MTEFIEVERPRTKRKLKGAKLAAALTVLMLCSVSMSTLAANAVPSGSTQTYVYTARNGADVIQIANPNGAGISRNVYSTFNIGTKGSVLNNATASVQTQVAGMFDANKNLQQSASMILNQVNSSRISTLNGALEIGGQKADMVLSNSNGITVKSATFINMNRAVLTTGIPQFTNGDLNSTISSYDVKGGKENVNGALNAKDTSALDVLAKTVAVNNDISAKQLNIVTGMNRISSDLKSIENLDTKWEVYTSLDASSLGAMHADELLLLVQQKGEALIMRV